MRKAAGKVRITGQLIDAVTGAHIWADRFERDLTDVFALQDEVTVAVVSAIQPKIIQTEIALSTRRRPENLTAYDFWLRAIQQSSLATREGLAEAIKAGPSRFGAGPRVWSSRFSGKRLSPEQRRFWVFYRSSIRARGSSAAFSPGIAHRRW